MSFALNFEVNAVIYDKEKATEMAEYFRKDLEVSQKITRSGYLGRTLGQRFKEQVCRLFSPVL